MKDYFKALNESMYRRKLSVSLSCLLLTIIMMFLLHTPVEKVLATYIVIDIIAMLLMVGLLKHYKVTYSKNNYPLSSLIVPETLKYIAIGVLIYAIMYYTTNYTTYNWKTHLINSVVIITLSIVFILKLKSYQDVYKPIIQKTYTEQDEFKKLCLFNNYDDLKLEYEAYYNNEFKLKSIEKKGIKVEDDFIYMGGVKYLWKHYFNYMKENEINTLEDLTEEDKILIAMINIH